MSEAAQEAATGVIDDLAAEFVADTPAEEPQAPAGSQEETVAEAEAQHEAVTEEEIPEDVLALINEPDFEAEAEAVVEAEQEEVETFDEYEDPNVAEERKKRIAAEKKAQWLEERIVRESSAKWKAEAAKYFPYADLDAIQPTSRRQVLREASTQHEKVKGLVDKAIAQRQAELEVSAIETRQQIKDEQAQAWGKPLAGPGGPPPASVSNVERGRARSAGHGLNAAIKQRLDAGVINLGLGGGEKA